MITDTRSTKIDEGTYTFEIASVPTVINASGFTKYQFELKRPTDDKPFKMSFFPNQMGGLLAAIGCQQIEEGVFDWEPEQVAGLQFQAELFYEEDKNGKINDKTGKVQMYYKLRNFTEAKNTTRVEDIDWK